MARNRKAFFHGIPYELTFRTESGLPFPAQALIKYAMESILARAQTLYGVEITAALLMSNHFHLIVVPDDPSSIPSFVGFIKRESAHMINRMLGRNRHTVWEEGYDSVPILDFNKVIERLAYIYSNPAKANLESSIDKYPNLSSWNAVINGTETLHRKAIPRENYSQLSIRTIGFEEQQLLLESTVEKCTVEYPLTFNSFGWLRCFEETRDLDPEVIRKMILAQVRSIETELSRKRKYPVKGAHALKLEQINLDYLPTKRGKKMLCLASTIAMRLRFIEWFKHWSEIAEEVYQRWKSGDYSVLFPPGFFLPGGALASNLNPYFLHF